MDAGFVLVAGLVYLASFGVAIYLVALATRLVRAVERIADKFDGSQ